MGIQPFSVIKYTAFQSGGEGRLYSVKSPPTTTEKDHFVRFKTPPNFKNLFPHHVVISVNIFIAYKH